MKVSGWSAAVLGGALLFVCHCAAAQVRGAAWESPLTPADSITHNRKMIHKAGFDVCPSHLFATDDFFRGTNAAQQPLRSALSLHLKYAFQFGPDTRFGRRYPYTSQGIGISVNDFRNRAEVGRPVAVYVFQNSRIVSLARTLSLDYEWNFGVSFGWEKYDAERNPFNVVVGSRINAYINLGLMFNWHFAPQWNVTAGAGLMHFSNGNTTYPNGGVNLLNGRFGLVYTFGRETIDGRRNRVRRFEAFTPHVSYDLVLYGALRTKGYVWPDRAYLIPGKFGVAGVNFNPMYNFSRFFRAGLSLDAQYDESANLKDHIANDNIYDSELRFHRPPFREQFAVGVSIRGEIVMPIFSINLGVGRNFICKGDDTDSFYQIFVLKADVTRHLFLHIGYQLYKFRNPNNLMLGVGYRFNRR